MGQSCRGAESSIPRRKENHVPRVHRGFSKAPQAVSRSSPSLSLFCLRRRSSGPSASWLHVLSPSTPAIRLDELERDPNRMCIRRRVGLNDERVRELQFGVAALVVTTERHQLSDDGSNRSLVFRR